MDLDKELRKRSDTKCELCGSQEEQHIYIIPPSKNESIDRAVLVCSICRHQIENPDETDPNHWRCLNDSMWSEHQPVQIVAWRMLNRLKKDGWPQDLLNMMYLEDEVLAFAKAMGEGNDTTDEIVHRDVNGAILEAGDSVVLIKDLKVKGSSMVAKQGTAVRRISLDHDNAEYIEGKVDGQHIVIITKFVKKI